MRDDHDVLDGTIQLVSGETGTFSFQGFHTDKPDVKADGFVTVGSSQVSIREIEGSWRDYRGGFVGANFYLNDEHVAQVIRSHKGKGDDSESVWVSSNLPQNTQHAIASTASAFLIAKRLQPPE